MTAILSRDGIAQRPRQPIQDAGPKEEPAHVVGLAIQDLLDEVVDDEAIVAGETRDEAVDIVPTLHGQGGQLERGDPTLRALLQRRDLARFEVQAGRLIEIRSGLLTREAQIRGSYFHELPLRPQTRQRKRWIGAGCDHDVRRWRQVLQQERHLVLDVAGIDHMEVIKHQEDVGSDRAKLVGEGRHDRLDGRWLGPFHHRDCLSRGGHRSVKCCRHAGPEGDGLVVGRVEGHPYRDQVVRGGGR